LKISLTGYNGFVGRNLIADYPNYFYQFISRTSINNNLLIDTDSDVVINLVGKAHDLKSSNDFEDYYYVNFELTKKIFDEFLKSNAKVFITLSSIKAVCDSSNIPLTENFLPNPVTHYGKSKLIADQYIYNKIKQCGKRIYILRPSMIHGPGNKGNLNLLFNFVKKGYPWPLGNYNNLRSYCSINNLTFIINELILNDNIASGIYNIADDETVSTNRLINLFSNSLNTKTKILYLPHFFIKIIGQMGDFFHLPFNSDNLDKLTTNFIVSNDKIKIAINKKLPINSIEGIKITIKSFLNL
jgi:nucleoside-diphosphate-sugar epimerase